jgi:hypothetical protein
VSHWKSGLPKLDIEPFDPTPLWDAVEDSQVEQQVAVDRRRRMLPFVGAGIAVALAAAVGAAVFLLG